MPSLTTYYVRGGRSALSLVGNTRLSQHPIKLLRRRGVRNANTAAAEERPERTNDPMKIAIYARVSTIDQDCSLQVAELFPVQSSHGLVATS